jgi:hypothetical protein
MAEGWKNGARCMRRNKNTYMQRREDYGYWREKREERKEKRGERREERGEVMSGYW